MLNPADAATRGLTAKQFRDHDTWLNGPSFLPYPSDQWPEQPKPPEDLLVDLLPETAKEMRVEKKKTKKPKSEVVCATLLQPASDDHYDPLIPNLLKYSIWKRLIRIIVTCLRWRSKRKGVMTPVEIWNAEASVAYLIQAESYRATKVHLQLQDRVPSGSSLAPLAPFVDTQGIIRLGGRIHAAHLEYNAKYPILLHPKDP